MKKNNLQKQIREHLARMYKKMLSEATKKGIKEAKKLKAGTK